MSEDLFEHYRFEVDKSQELLRLDKFLMNRIRYATRNRIQNVTRDGKILVNEKIVKPHYRVKPGDIITVVFHEPKKNKEILPEDIALDIVYEDNYLMVINKPAGMVVHPAFNNYSGTLINALLYHFGKIINQENILTKPGLVHRLDKNTSGLMVIAKEKSSLDNLLKQFYHHEIQRTYKALVWGILKEKEGQIVSSLFKDEKNKRYISANSGKQAITNYKVLEDYGYASLVECKLETGRSHQIRVHLRSIVHPIINDELYDGDIIPEYAENEELSEIFKIIKRQALHSSSIRFIHPVTQEEIFIECPLPDDISLSIDFLKSITVNM